VFIDSRQQCSNTPVGVKIFNFGNNIQIYTNPFVILNFSCHPELVSGSVLMTGMTNFNGTDAARIGTFCTKSQISAKAVKRVQHDKKDLCKFVALLTAVYKHCSLTT
jgi:hypothetical protein